MPLVYEQQYRRWLAREVGPVQKVDEDAGTIACTSLYSGKYFYELRGKTLPYAKHWLWKARDLAEDNVDKYMRRASYNEQGNARAFNFNLDIDVPFAVEEPWTYNLTRRLIKTFCVCVSPGVDISTVQVILCTTLDEDYNMAPYTENYEECPYCKGEVLPENREVDVLSCRGCKTKWTFMPTGDGKEEVYVKEYGATAEQDTERPHRIPRRKTKVKTGIHVIFANAVVSLAQAQQLMAAMLQEAMVFDKTISVAQWYEIIDQAPLHRKDDTKPIGLREVFSSKGDRCKCCRGKGKILDFRDSHTESECTECYGAGRYDKGKKYMPLDIFYLCHINPEREPWDNDTLVQMADKQEMELERQGAWPESIPRPMAEAKNLAERAAAAKDRRVKNAKRRAMQDMRQKKMARGERLLPADYDEDDDSAEARAAARGALVEDDLVAVADDNWDGGMHRRAQDREKERKKRRMKAVDRMAVANALQIDDDEERDAVLGDKYRWEEASGARISHPREIWPHVKDRSSKTGYRASTPLDELARIRPSSALDYFYCLQLCSISYVLSRWRCQITLQMPNHFPSDIFEYGAAAKKSSGRTDNRVRRLMQVDPSRVTRNQLMQAQTTRKFVEVDEQLHSGMLDVIAGFNPVYARCRVDHAYYTNDQRTRIECYLDGPNSNYCMNKCGLHHSSRAKAIFSSTQGVLMKCTSIKTQFGCAKWTGTLWRQMDPSYRNTLFKSAEDGPSHRYNWPMLVETYPYLKKKFSGEANLHKLKKYMHWVKQSVFILNAFNRCSYTDSIKIYTVKQYLWQMNKNHNAFVEDLEDWGELVEVVQPLSEVRKKSLATRITGTSRARKMETVPVSQLGTPTKQAAFETRPKKKKKKGEKGAKAGTRRGHGRRPNFRIWRPAKPANRVPMPPRGYTVVQGPNLDNVSPALRKGLRVVEQAVRDGTDLDVVDPLSQPAGEEDGGGGGSKAPKHRRRRKEGKGKGKGKSKGKSKVSLFSDVSE